MIVSSLFIKGRLSYDKLIESFQGWNAYAKWADCYKLRRGVLKRIYAINKSL